MEQTKTHQNIEKAVYEALDRRLDDRQERYYRLLPKKTSPSASPRDME